MLSTDWGNMALAFSAMAGLFGWATYVGMSITWNKPPRFEPRMDEPQLKVFWPNRARR